MSYYAYKGYGIVSGIVSSDVVPARVSVKVWAAGANHRHDAPVYFCKTLDQAFKWVDAGATKPLVSPPSQRH